jgi:hypothetical protein
MVKRLEYSLGIIWFNGHLTTINPGKLQLDSVRQSRCNGGIVPEGRMKWD